jgi:zinc ribbon protein
LEPKIVSQYCTNCGTELPKQALFCTSCGQAVSKEIPEHSAIPTQPRASRVPSHSGEDEDLGSSASSSWRWGKGGASASLWDWLERLVLYAALPVVTFYPIGAFHYWLQLMVHYGLDEDGAMYAVILLSREYVIGQVIWALTVGLRRLFPIVIPAVLISFVITTLGWRGIFGSSRWKTTPVRRLATVVGLLALGGVLLFVLITQAIEGLPWWRIIGRVIVLSGSFLGGYLAAKDRNRNKRVTEMTRAPLFVRRWPLQHAP